LARHVPHERPDRFNIFENNNTKQQSNKEVIRRQEVKKAAYLDKDERELAKSLENEEWVSDLTKKEKKQYQEDARHSLNKRKRINIRMTERDLKKIRAKAIEEGIPYQSLIAMLIHKYNEGKLSVNR
jgi:predicted DNA binding CopG/RHH family protein